MASNSIKFAINDRRPGGRPAADQLPENPGDYNLPRAMSDCDHFSIIY